MVEVSKNNFKVSSYFSLNLIIYLSLIFLIYSLYSNNLILIPKVNHGLAFILSLILLFLFYIMDAFCWYKILSLNKIKTSFSESLISTGVPIFSRYVPGKILTFLGPASYISHYTGEKISYLTFISLQHQFITMIFSCLFAIIYFSIVQYDLLLILFSLIIFLFLTTIVTNKRVNGKISMILKKYNILSFSIPTISFKKILLVGPYVIFFWSILTLSFYLLAVSLYTDQISWYHGLLFPVSITIGNFAIFTPGGLGVREGALAYLLLDSGLDVQTAATLSIISRTWSFFGELSFFSFAVFINKGIGAKKIYE